VTSHPDDRIVRVRERMIGGGLDALVLLSKADCRYLTGFTGEAASVCVTPDEVVLFTDPRFTVQAQEQASDARIVIYSSGRDDLLPGVLEETLRRGGRARSVVGVDPTYLTVKRWDHLRPLLEGADVEWRLVDGLVEGCRQVKSSAELSAIRASAELVSQTFGYLEGIAVVGRTELDVSLDIEVHLRRNGSEGIAFPFIVAGGPRGAMPHAEPSARVIEPRELVVFDIGAVVDGYASDISRTYATGPLDRDLVEAYEAVRDAQAAAVAAARAGIPSRDLDSVARDRLATANLAEYFVHSLGHGVGLEVHEGPTLSLRSDDLLEPGMVVTIEPGVYLPERAGIRIEDTVIIHEDHAEIITEWPRDLRFLS
jgi:Xaa-Pro aminopeptidase